MDELSRDHEITAFFTNPGTYPGLPLRPALSCRLHFGEAHHLLWRCWSLFDDGQHVYGRRIEWPCKTGQQSPTGEFTHTFAAECVLERRLADALIADAMTAAVSPVPTAEQACGIDGLQRLVQSGLAAEQPFLHWEKSANGSGLDLWFERAVDVLNQRLPESSAKSDHLIRADQVSSKAASDPRQESANLGSSGVPLSPKNSAFACGS